MTKAGQGARRKPFNLAEVKRRIGGLDKETAAKTVCALVGHSRIVTACFGYIDCARCKATIADKLGGAGYAQAAECVQVGHNCAICRKNYKRLDWRDKFLTPNPFTKKAR